MKTKVFYFLLIFSTTSLSAQYGKFPKMYYPQVFFNKMDAEKALEAGSSSIRGVASSADNMTGQSHFAKEGTLVILLPYTEYLNEWLNLSKKHKNNSNTVFMMPEVFDVRRETTTDDYGNFTFNNLKPGKYYVESIIDFYATALGRQQSGTIYSSGYGYAYSTPVYEYYNYKYNTQKKAYKILDIKNDGTISDVKLRPTILIPFIDLDVVSAKTSGINCHLERNLQFGTCYEYFDDGKPKIIAEWRKNLYHGDYKEYYDTGNIRAEGKFKNGHKVEEWKYYNPETAQLSAREYFKYMDDSSVLDGDVIFYFKNGAIRQLDRYKNGKSNGECLEFYENGTIKNKVYYKDDLLHGLAFFYNEKGEIIEEINYLNGKPQK